MSGTPPAYAGSGRGTTTRSMGVSIGLMVCRLLLAALFGYAAFLKLQNPQAFAFSVKAFDILPEHLALLATFAIPWTEIFISICLVLGLWTRAAALLLSVLLIIFIAGIVSVLERHLSVKCGCFGNAAKGICGETLGWCNVIQNTVLLAMSLALAFAGHGRLGLDRQTT